MRRMKIRGVIFDRDGTITEPYIEFDKIKTEVDVGNRYLIDYMKTAPLHEVERLQKILTRYEEAGVPIAKMCHSNRRAFGDGET